MATIQDLGAFTIPWPARISPFSGLGALELPLPRSYDATKGFRVGARPLPLPDRAFGIVVRSATYVGTRPQAVNYARGGYHAARKLAGEQPVAREAWLRVAQLYGFVHDLDLWVQSRPDVVFDEPLRDRYLADLRGKLRFADGEADKLRKAAPAPRPAPEPELVIPPPPRPDLPPDVAPAEQASIIDTLFRGTVFGVPKPVAWLGAGTLIALGVRAMDAS